MAEVGVMSCVPKEGLSGKAHLRFACLIRVGLRAEARKGYVKTTKMCTGPGLGMQFRGARLLRCNSWRWPQTVPGGGAAHVQADAHDRGMWSA
eukprot:CAMPEP_0174358516 /NCGR_PEP_ID=MMETSP0811_2-20130205/43220_1 /TAXON_ID=73025 ORGANISM="Eutreptiella gymnastica-like, Strain CCMP1594" /NCGR_SAMPLE_ID=MMETSP0811_2 /ASSEMBLY_ACC=CAM_ASM_000667 /LENGTH=92 /DNA_ID=CAMNT_0015492371 /DNA_START=225 /DNA_END=503 /DNA_ORIENTATION=-